MTSSYNENISRLKNATQANLAQYTKQNTAVARWKGESGIQEANNIAESLSELSTSLKTWKLADQKEKIHQGKLERRKHKLADAKKLEALHLELAQTKEEDTRFHEIKGEILRIGGEDAYVDADRIAHLSPWQQVGYANEKLRAFKETLPDKLANAMATSQKSMILNGVTFSAAELANNNITGLPFKEAAVTTLTDDIAENAGIYGYSPEMLKYAGVSDAIQKAKDDEMDKHRTRYNLDSSAVQRQKNLKEWNASDKTGEDLHRLILKNGVTIGEDGKVLGNAGGWTTAMAQLKSEGIGLGRPDLADYYGNMTIPPTLAAQLGVKQGTTFAQHWPGRFKALKADIKSGIATARKAENTYLKSAGLQLENQIIQTKRLTGKDFTPEEIHEIANKFGDLGLQVPESILNYNSQSERDYTRDKKWLELRKGHNGGGIYPHDLQGLHPRLVGEKMKEAKEFEENKIGENSFYGKEAMGEIDGMLVRTWTDMGEKGKIKSPEFKYAKRMAFRDFQRKFLEARAQGLSPKDAYKYATTEPGGVLKELDKKAKSKYVVTTQQRFKEDANRPSELTVRMGLVNDSKKRINSISKDKRVVENYLQTTILEEGREQLAILNKALKNGQPIYGLRASDEVQSALAYFDGVAYTFPNFTGMQLLKWQINAFNIEAQKAKQQKEGNTNE